MEMYDFAVNLRGFERKASVPAQTMKEDINSLILT